MPTNAAKLLRAEALKENERLFETLWKTYAPNAPVPIKEYCFAPDRKYRFDFAWLGCGEKVAVEIDGGNRKAILTRRGPVAVGRHTQAKDYEKLNLAAALGWRVFRFLPEMLKRDPVTCIDLVLTVVDPVPFQDVP